MTEKDPERIRKKYYFSNILNGFSKIIMLSFGDMMFIFCKR